MKVSDLKPGDRVRCDFWVGDGETPCVPRDAVRVKALIKNDLIRDTVEIDPFGGGYIPDDAPKVCALGSVGIGRGLNMEALDPEDYDSVADAFRIAPRLAQEIAFQNDDAAWHATPAERWQRMRDWAASRLKAAP